MRVSLAHMLKSAFHPRVSVSLMCAARWPVAQSLEFLNTLGVQAISVTGSQLSTGYDQVISHIRDSGMAVASVGTGGHSLIQDPATTLDILQPIIDAAVALKSPFAFSVSGPAADHMPNDDAFTKLIDCLSTARSYAGDSGVRLAIEHSSIATRQLGFVHTLADACWLSHEADVDVVVELQNCWYERGLHRIFKENYDRFAIVNVSDFCVGEELKLNRRVPGDGSIPLEWLIGGLLEAGYAGQFDLEYLGPAIEAEGYESAISRGLDWLCERLTRWGV